METLYNKGLKGNDCAKRFRSLLCFWNATGNNITGRVGTLNISNSADTFTYGQFKATPQSRKASTVREGESSKTWNGVSVSDTGQYQTAVVYDGYIYISSDYGDTWEQKERNYSSSRTYPGILGTVKLYSTYHTQHCLKKT